MQMRENEGVKVDGSDEGKWRKMKHVKADDTR